MSLTPGGGKPWVYSVPTVQGLQAEMERPSLAQRLGIREGHHWAVLHSGREGQQGPALGQLASRSSAREWLCLRTTIGPPVTETQPLVQAVRMLAAVPGCACPSVRGSLGKPVTCSIRPLWPLLQSVAPAPAVEVTLTTSRRERCDFYETSPPTELKRSQELGLESPWEAGDDAQRLSVDSELLTEHVRGGHVWGLRMCREQGSCPWGGVSLWNSLYRS